MKSCIALACFLVGSAVRAGEPAPEFPPIAMDLPASVRSFYSNPDGSCVQCSLGMVGAAQGIPEIATILWRTDYGKAERGGGYPERTARYAESRGLQIYNITGPGTYECMKWAIATGRGCAIGCGGSHFQTLVGYDPKTSHWFVCNNNSPKKIDEYDDATFRRKHEASGRWIIIADYPPASARPTYVNWWD